MGNQAERSPRTSHFNLSYIYSLLWEAMIYLYTTYDINIKPYQNVPDIILMKRLIIDKKWKHSKQIKMKQ